MTTFIIMILATFAIVSGAGLVALMVWVVARSLRTLLLPNS